MQRAREKLVGIGVPGAILTGSEKGSGLPTTSTPYGEFPIPAKSRGPVTPKKKPKKSPNRAPRIAVRRISPVPRTRNDFGFEARPVRRRAPKFYGIDSNFDFCYFT